MSTLVVRLRRVLLVWHRRIGVVLSLLLVHLAVSGFLLNHTSDFKLDVSAVSVSAVAPEGDWLGQALYRWYGLALPAASVVSLNPEASMFLLADGQKLLLKTEAAERELALCEGAFFGALSWSPSSLSSQSASSQALTGFVVVACHASLMLLTPDGELVERLELDASLIDLESVSYIQGGMALLIKTASGMFSFDPFVMAWRKLPADFVDAGLERAAWIYPQTLPSFYSSLRRAGLVSQLDALDSWRISGDLHWQRVVQDLHSGRFFGSMGVWVVDLSALLLLVLALSGLWMWGVRRVLLHRAAKVRLK